MAKTYYTVWRFDTERRFVMTCDRREQAEAFVNAQVKRHADCNGYFDNCAQQYEVTETDAYGR